MIESDILNHANQCGDEESCGFAIELNNQQRYLPCKNISSNPEEFFEISSNDWIAAESKGKIIALVHSHPNGLPILSEADQMMQQRTQLDWWLVCDGSIHKFRYMLPLIGRDFVHGSMDCYTLFRDAYHLCGFNFPNFHRNHDWWLTSDDLYLANISQNGFYQTDEMVQLGDVLLICLGSTKPNHAAIYVGNQMILHHAPNRKSKRDVYNGFWLKYTHSIWRHKKWQSSNFMAILNNLAISSE